MSIVLRQATLEDAAAVAELAARTFALACPPTASPADIAASIADQLSEERFRAYIADPQRQVAIALSEGRMVGYTMLIFAPPAEDVARQLTATPTVELSKIYVDPAHHGGGVARLLGEDAVARAQASGAAAIWLGTNQANERAQRFYEKQGFVRVGTKRFRLGSQWEDDFIFERVFSADGGRDAPGDTDATGDALPDGPAGRSAPQPS